jgi:REP element-mobilizing transposase RayT
MSEFLKMEDGKCYFVTFTVVDWLDVFAKLEYSDILVNGIQYCQKHKGLEIYAYCIMPSHIHMIASTRLKLGDILRYLKKYTSKAIVKAIEDNPRESKRELFLACFRKAAMNSNRHKHYCFWRDTNHPVEIYSDKFYRQKEMYIHMNPVEEGLVSKPEHYRLSSASDESPIKILSWYGF